MSISSFSDTLHTAKMSVDEQLYSRQLGVFGHEA
jgi:hypothetical protein